MTLFIGSCYPRAFILNPTPLFTRTQRIVSRLFSLLERHPIASFFAVVLLLFGLIALGHRLRTPAPSGPAPVVPEKTSAIFTAGHDAATLTVPVTVKKAGTVDVVALVPGIVSRVLVSPGAAVSAGRTLVTLTNDYGSGDSSVQKAIAAEDDRLTRDLAGIDRELSRLQERETTHDATLTDRQQSIALKGIEKDRATRQSNLVESALRLALVQGNDAVFNPRAAATGTVEQVHVNPGDFVTAGTPLVSLRSAGGVTTLEAAVTLATAHLFDPTRPARLVLADGPHDLLPVSFSTEETGTDGLFSIIYALPDSLRASVTDGETVTLALPLTALGTRDFLVPIDTVFQDPSGDRVVTEENGMAVSKPVTLGAVFGSFVEVTDGLAAGDRVILNRAVIVGDRVTVTP